MQLSAELFGSTYTYTTPLQFSDRVCTLQAPTKRCLEIGDSVTKCHTCALANLLEFLHDRQVPQFPGADNFCPALQTGEEADLSIIASHFRPIALQIACIPLDPPSCRKCNAIDGAICTVNRVVAADEDNGKGKVCAKHPQTPRRPVPTTPRTTTHLSGSP